MFWSGRRRRVEDTNRSETFSAWIVLRMCKSRVNRFTLIERRVSGFNIDILAFWIARSYSSSMRTPRRFTDSTRLFLTVIF